MKATVEEELKTHKQDREDATAAAEAKANIAAIKKAVVAIRKGMGDSFLQSALATRLQRAVLSSTKMNSFDQEEVTAYLQGKAQGSSGEIVGILETMQEQMEADLKEAEETEAAAIQDFD